MRHYYTDPVTGQKVYAKGPEDDEGPPVCGFCGDVEVSGEGETCAACLTQQDEKRAERFGSDEDPYADLDTDPDNDMRNP
jgi:hypothetical protein